MTQIIDATDAGTGDVVDQYDEVTETRRLGVIKTTESQNEFPGDIEVRFRYDDGVVEAPYSETLRTDELDHESITIYRDDDDDDDDDA